MPEITSHQNEYVKRLKGLGRKKERQEKAEILLEGTRLIGDALDSGLEILACLYDEQHVASQQVRRLLDLMKGMGIQCHSTTAQILEACSDTVTPQGIVANARLPVSPDLPSILQTAPDGMKSIMILDGLQDPGNLGTIIRSACAGGAQAVIIGPGTVDPYGPKALRSAMGAIFRVPIVTIDNMESAITLLKAEHYGIYYAAGEVELIYTDADFTLPTAIVIGNEGAGVSQDIRKICHSGVKIPMYNGMESLNASVAASLLLFEVVRQQKNP